jgi:sigma-E factor negative regulatory protein RseC
MIEETALVSRIEPGRVWLKAQPSGACGGCAHQDGCSTLITAKLLPERELEIDCNIALAIGSEVIVAIDDKHLLLGSFLLYLMPLLAMFIGLITADSLLAESSKENWLIPISFVSLMAGFRLARHWQHGLSNSRIKPMISDKV